MMNESKRFFLGLILAAFVAGIPLPSVARDKDGEKSNDPEVLIEEPLYKPFIERYILDELKLLRQDQQSLRGELAEKVAMARIEATDRAVGYTADTVNIVFYVITMAASILVVVGWKSFRDIRTNIEAVTAAKVSDLIEEYEKRLDLLEEGVRVRTQQIIATQEEISNTNVIHSLWMRAGLEKSEQEKVKIYDKILEIKKNDIEALTYKADSLLDLGEVKWALSLADQAVEQDESYALAYWQRACAKVELGRLDEAVEDIRAATGLSEALREEVSTEDSFEKLKGYPAFQELLGELRIDV